MKSPPNISVALTLPTTTRSPNGLGQMAAAIEQVAYGTEQEAKAKPAKNRAMVDPSDSTVPGGSRLGRRDAAFDRAHEMVVRQTKQGNGHGADALAELTTGGLTFFAPVDDAWNDEAWAQVGKAGVGPRLLGNHVRLSTDRSPGTLDADLQYTNNETVFSTAWYNKNASLNVMTGQTLQMWFDNETSEHKLSMGEQTAVILRPDIVLENGVLHIIDKVLTVPSGAENEPLRSMRPSQPTAAADKTTGAFSTSKTPAEETAKIKAEATSGAMLGRGVSVQVTILAGLVGAVMFLVE